jgi:hypothetical protein
MIFICPREVLQERQYLTVSFLIVHGVHTITCKLRVRFVETTEARTMDYGRDIDMVTSRGICITLHARGKGRESHGPPILDYGGSLKVES